MLYLINGELDPFFKWSHPLTKTQIKSQPAAGEHRSGIQVLRLRSKFPWNTQLDETIATVSNPSISYVRVWASCISAGKENTWFCYWKAERSFFKTNKQTPRDFRSQFPPLLQVSPLCPREARVHDLMKSNSPKTSGKVSYSSFG